MRFKKILVGIDFSPPSREAMRAAAAMAKEFGAELTVAHFWQIPLLGAELPVQAAYLDEMRAAAEQELAAWTAEASSLADRKVTSVFEMGVPWNEMVKLLQRDRYDLAVVGTHGRTGLKHALLGSVAERVVRHAPCAVLVAR